MTTLPAQLFPLNCLAGVMPSTDRSPFATEHYTAASGIEFWNGLPQKIAGWREFTFDGDVTIEGVSRSFYSAILTTFIQNMIGTNEHLYGLRGSRLTNITPLETTTHLLASKMATDYATLANNPITTVSGSGIITVADTNTLKYQASDIYTLSGSTTVNNIAAALINADHIIRALGTNLVTVYTAGTANASGAGGGASVVRATGAITVSSTNVLSNGDRIKVTGATTTGGILNTEINMEHIVRAVSSTTFSFMTDGTATGAVVAGGGTTAYYSKEIDGGLVNQSLGQGYGMGMYGAGLYGVSKSSTEGIEYPRIWFFDRFGELILATPGNQTGLYSWGGDITEAPALVSGAPTAINYQFVSNNIAVTLGASGVGNKIKTSDQGNLTQWTASSTNQVFEDDIEGAGRFTSHVSVSGINLLFTQQQTYIFAYIGGSLIWQIQLLSANIGLIAPMARLVVDGVAYWMSQNNWYRWAGGNVEIIPANSQIQSTILNYIYNNLNSSQLSKIFADYNKEKHQIQWHVPSASSNEPDLIARLSLHDMSWVPDDSNERTAAEYPNNLSGAPRMMNSNLLYVHETGTDDDVSALPFSITGNKRTGGKPNMLLTGIIPDSTQSGTITASVASWQFPQSPNTTYGSSYAVTSTTERLTTQIGGRVWQHTISGEELGQDWRMGQWQEYQQAAGNN